MWHEKSQKTEIKQRLSRENNTAQIGLNGGITDKMPDVQQAI